MTNRELFVLDPIENKLLNKGVADINTDKKNADGQKVIEYELKTFVCEGEYERGLNRILEAYLRNIEEPTQPAVWVSGFFGSGKSHLVKMLGYFWENYELPSGDTARKIKQLPSIVADSLFQLEKKQKKHGRLSIAGTLKDFPAEDIRYSFFQFFLDGLGLPPKFHHFKFIHWLKKEGIHDDLKNLIEAKGEDFKKEYNNLFVSPHISKGILELRPDFAPSAAEASKSLRAQFPSVKTISRDEMLSTIKDEVLPMFYDEVPCILIVLDEVQQFIGSNRDKAIDVQNLSQDLSNGFSGKLLFVATGQNALSDTPFLQPLVDRFYVKVNLSDQDVEKVTRKTVLEKKPSAITKIKSVTDPASGEIARNLQNTAFAYTTSDSENIVSDYPILPSTRKFWKKVLAVIDTAGTQGQLRSQLRIVDETIKEVAKEDLGNIIPADFIFSQKRDQLLQNARLLNETDNLIVKLKQGDAKEQLQGRILSVVFLLDQLPENLPGGTPLSNKETISDLLIDDLTQSSDAFRLEVSNGIDDLVNSQLLMPLGEEFRLQTKAGQEWEKEFIAHTTRLISQGDDIIQTERNNRIIAYYTDEVRGIRLSQGDAKVPRDIHVHYGTQKPNTDNKVNLWIRDGWMENEKAVLDEIRREGTDAPLSYAYVKKHRGEDIKSELVKYIAAKKCLDTRGIPADDEGKMARKSMETRMQKANEEIRDLIHKITEEAEIYLAGGTKVREAKVKSSIEHALKQLLNRQFPEFGKGDHTSWGQALKSAANKSPNPLEKIGFQEDIHSHPVASSILRHTSTNGVSGRDIRSQFTKSPFGWPQDAIDTVLIALTYADYLNCSEDPITQGKIGVATFKKEAHTLTAVQKIKLRKMFTDVGLTCNPGEESRKATEFLEQLENLQRSTTGAAPLLEPKTNNVISQIKFQEGNERLLQMVAEESELKALHTEYSKKAALVIDRMPQWELLQRLLNHADDNLQNEKDEAQAIVASRLLLEASNPIEPLLQKVTSHLKSELNTLQKQYKEDHEIGMKALQDNEYFSKLTPEQKHQILLQNRLLSVQDIVDYDANGLSNALGKRPIEGWQDKIASLGNQYDKALSDAVRLLEPKAESYALPKRTLSSEKEIELYISKLDTELKDLLKSAKSIILK